MLNNICRLCGKNTTKQNALIIFENKNILWSIQVLTGLIVSNKLTNSFSIFTHV